MQLKSFLYLTSVLTVALAATVADVLSDLAAVKSQVTTLDSAINGFPNSGGSLLAALAIHTDATNVESAVNKATTDAQAVTPNPVSETDGTSVLNAVTGIQPIIIDALNAIVTKKAAFQALPIGGIPALVLQDLQTLSTDTQALENALVAAAPSDIKTQAQPIINDINAAFATAIAAYS